MQQMLNLCSLISLFTDYIFFPHFLPSDRLSPPLDIQLETINCTAFNVRWKMPRRHVSTITGYKVVHFLPIFIFQRLANHGKLIAF